MSTIEDIERRQARGQAVDAAYQALEIYQADRRRIVFLPDTQKRAGGYGIVRPAHLYATPYLPAWLATRLYGPPQVVAVKQIKISAIDNVDELKRAFTKEMLVWSGLETHPGVAKFVGFCADFWHTEAWLISPWEPYGNVSEFIRGRELEVPEKLSLVYDTIDALTFLHQLNPPVCHGDIKSANVLVNAKYRAVLCDFGLARLYEDSGFGRLETSTGFKGSIRWCSPELLNGHPRTPNSDVYAWAWLVWEIMTGELPYEGSGADYIIMRQIFESPRPQVNGESRLSDCLQVWELMIRCWGIEPLQRPTSNMCRTTVRFLPRCPPTPRDHQHQARSAALLENLGDLESWKGNYEEGLAYLEQALQLYEKDENNRGIASVLRKQASISYRHSYPVKTLDAASAALEKFKRLGDPLGTAESLYLIGSAMTVQSKEEEATTYLEQALTIFRTHGNDVGIVQCLERIGEIHRRKRRNQEALDTLEEAVGIASRCGDKLGEAKVLIILGVAHMDNGELTRSASILSEACDIARRVGWEYGVCTALWDLGTLKLREDNYPEAEGLLQESLTAARRTKAPWRLAQVLGSLGLCLRSQGRADEAIKAYEGSYSAYQEISLGEESANTASIVAELKRDQGSRRDSLVWYSSAIAEYRKIGDKYKVSMCLGEKARVLVDMEEYDEAVLHFEASLILDQELGYGLSWNQERLSKIPKTIIKWESRKYSKPRGVGVQQVSPLLCDVARLQRRLPQLRSPGLKLAIRNW
ncbi:hypothetical protein M407DRAFT_28867 [Tulasnella calospora MUT 4182]|uniref:Protein kinase domain-containing protein n=1 Tax=Tulasnella calospora MUT 4182 TaxID=1051891 RepID=A0A0C3Q0K5_9AGAM|nr:hypothetical protein M407DRAFT_28867 [Tulasnella calospora MUT 4182]